VIYRDQWLTIIRGFFTAAFRGSIRTESERLSMLLLVGTLPTATVGVYLEHQIKVLFATPKVAAAFLIVNGLVMLGAELLRRRSERSSARAGTSRHEQEERFGDAEHISFRAAVLVGACQSLALIPGISRSGVTIAGGLVAGLRHVEAARFSFLLATPVILAAGVVEVPQLFVSGVQLGEYVAGAVLAAIAAYLSARFLLRYFRSGRLDPYGLYCIAAGVVSLLLLTLRS
jgi:undecaprenyl-diphosphatase